MFREIIYCGQPKLNKFILVNFPTHIDMANAFEKDCARISAMIYPNGNPGSSKIEIKNDAIDTFNIDSLFQKQFKLKTMNDWSYEKFEEKMGNKVSYGVILGETMSGKTEVAKHLKDKMGHKVIDMKQITADVKASLATEDGEYEGEIPIDKVEAAITTLIESDTSCRYVFDDFTHKEEDDFIAFVSKFGQPEYLLFLTAEKDTIKARYLKKNEKEEIGDDDLEIIKEN